MKDHWFRVDATTRLLNDPVDVSAAPNQHAALSRNILTSSFDAVFYNPLTNAEETYTLGPSTTGYPPQFRRQVDLTVTEPNPHCHEGSLYRAGLRSGSVLQQLPDRSLTLAMPSTRTSSE